jgi:ornithine cyclodeaminase/alanine dehydrogenase-like protein (mu-crystallin family)
MSALYLTEDDVEQLVDMRLAIEVVEEAFRRLAAGDATNVPRVRAKAPGIILHSMSAAAGYLGLVGWKNYTTTKHGAKFHVGLYSQQSGELLALVEAETLGQIRTGATTGVAAQWLAAPTATEIGLFGAGWQAESQLAALATVRPLKRVFVYSRKEQDRTAFADEMSEELGLEVVPVDRPQEAVQDLPIVVTATTSTEPVFDGNWLADGALVCAIGSNMLTKAEIDPVVVRRADNVVCDSVEACRNEAGDFVEAIAKGIFNWSRAIELADVVAGKAVCHSRSQNISLFKSVGLAIEDVALGGTILELARAKGLGRELPF